MKSASLIECFPNLISVWWLTSLNLHTGMKADFWLSPYTKICFHLKKKVLKDEYFETDSMKISGVVKFCHHLFIFCFTDFFRKLGSEEEIKITRGPMVL